MAYKEDLTAVADWIASIQNPDGGWGLAPGQGSSLVNTAEAVLVLWWADGPERARTEGLRYLEDHLFAHLEERGPRTRYLSFSLVALSVAGSAEHALLKLRVERELLNAKNSDNGWGVEICDQQSQLFSTFLAVWALRHSGVAEVELEQSYEWVLSRRRSPGWALSPDSPGTPVATAYALCCLAGTALENHEAVREGRDQLLQNDRWEISEEVIEGTVWKHSTLAWAIPALVSLDTDPYAPVISDAVRYVSKQLRHSESGWHDSELKPGRTIRAQFWVVHALESIRQAFDPTKHVMRIDAERSETRLQEPHFVKIAVRSRWAVVIPSKLYILFAYILIGAGVLVATGLLAWAHVWADSLAPPLVGRVGNGLIALALVGSGYLLVKRRRHLFRRTYLLLAGVAALAGVLNVWNGWTVLDMVAWLQSL